MTGVVQRIVLYEPELLSEVFRMPQKTRAAAAAPAGTEDAADTRGEDGT